MNHPLIDILQTVRFFANAFDQVIPYMSTLQQPSADKALIYVLRSRSMVGAALQARLGVDSKWVGVNRPGNYFYFELEPGPHYFCVEAVKMEHGLLS
ncbi:MAG TPA: hypothetical protein VMP68_03860, partial [Candidatus Eisenbacteria bacterium]|nr:hypothetical protein [Candidatus Eisenbacteria bacterium]